MRTGWTVPCQRRSGPGWSGDGHRGGSMAERDRRDGHARRDKMRLLGGADESEDLGRRLGWEEYTYTACAHSFVIGCRRAAVSTVESYPLFYA
jgi:hypothetical protein